MCSSIGMSAPSPDADWLVAAKRQQRISPRPNKSAAAAAAAAATAGSVDARAFALPSSVVGDSVVAAGDTAAADAATAARREREAAVAAAVAMTAASSSYQRSSFSIPAASVSSSYAESSSDAVTSTASHLDVSSALVRNQQQASHHSRCIARMTLSSRNSCFLYFVNLTRCIEQCHRRCCCLHHRGVRCETQQLCGGGCRCRGQKRARAR